MDESTSPSYKPAPLPTYPHSHRALDHSPDRMLGRRDHSLYIVFVGNASSHHLHKGPSALKILHCRLRFWFRCTRPSKKDKVPGSTKVHPFGDAATKAAQAADHEVAFGGTEDTAESVGNPLRFLSGVCRHVRATIDTHLDLRLRIFHGDDHFADAVGVG